MHLSASPRRLGARARARLEHFRLRRGLDPDGAPAHAAARLRAFRSLAEAAPAEADVVWRPLGPFAIPHGQTHGSGPRSRPAVAGRVTAVAVDPFDGAHLLLGTGGGGVWESRDGGASWRPRTDGLPVPAIGAVAFDPADPAVAYAGSGEGAFSAELGVGLLRSIDGGTSWRLMAADALTGAGFHDLAVLPDGRLLAATSTGLYESDYQGASWTRRLAGQVWDLSPAGDGVGHLWRRDRPGAPFDPVKPPADLQSQQAWYAWVVAAPPDHPEVLLLGAVGLHRGVRGADGRWSWVDLSARPAGDDLPADQHAVAFAP